MKYVILLGGALFAVAAIAQFGSILVAVFRLGRRDGYVADPALGVSVIRTVCGIENFVEQTLRSTFQLDYPRYEILFCVADAKDPVIAVVQRLIAAYSNIEARLLIGNNAVSANPKLNNLVKGWRAARYDWILMADSNLLMPRDHLQRMLSAWRRDTGLVCSPPVGGAPQNLWAELECAFLNTYQARWQYIADSIGLGFAQGKAMLWRREVLERAGGIEVLGSELAEDAAATKTIRAQGLRVRLVAQPFMQPLGYRGAAEVWRRQLRWARLRRATFRLFFLPELLAGIVAPLVAVVATALAAGWPIGATVVLLVAAWYGAEAYLAHRAGWQLSHWSIPAWMLRDALLPALWISAWVGNEFEWRGNPMSVALETAAARDGNGHHVAAMASISIMKSAPYNFDTSTRVTAGAAGGVAKAKKWLRASR
jgi:ceramide glucosyltransferase